MTTQTKTLKICGKEYGLTTSRHGTLSLLEDGKEAWWSNQSIRTLGIKELSEMSPVMFRDIVERLYIEYFITGGFTIKDIHPTHIISEINRAYQMGLEAR